MRTIAGLFENVNDADRAVKALQKAGFEKEDLSILAQNAIIQKEKTTSKAVDDSGESRATSREVAEGSEVGALGGGIAGGALGLLVGAGAITIPGIGPAIAAGTLASTIAGLVGGVGVGSITGVLIGAMAKLGIPKEEAHVYAEGVKRGGVLITVQADASQVSKAKTIMTNANVMKINDLREQWEAGGWTEFDQDKPPGNQYPVLGKGPFSQS